MPVIIMDMACFSLSLFLFRLLPISQRFKYKVLQGIVVNGMLLALGLLLAWQKDTRHSTNWYGNNYRDGDLVVIRINEPLTEKAKSFKAEACVESVIHNDSVTACTGKLLLYFSKDSITQNLRYGDRILVHKNLQPIKNSGNPGAFDYEQYAAFHGIFHNVFLKQKDWVLLHDSHVNVFSAFLFSARESILSVLRRHLNTGKDELGIAEALLIGYTQDLDKDLVQAYSNTGVVHIIAISGMHLALIYVMLVWLFARIPLVKRSKILQVVLILACLWLFSLLTGAAASVLRSAVMFTFICIGKNFVRQSSVYNSLAASAFVLLCYDPYFLWDVGFQLSYLALAGIIAFQKPLYGLFFIKNKWIDKVWQLAAVSLAAQVLTFPVCIYYFHQFPTLFLLANIIVVPLSGIILYAEIFLLALAWIPFVGNWLGRITAWMVWLMNAVITRINQISFSVWDKIPATLFSTTLLYVLVIAVSVWLLNKQKRALQTAMICMFLFTMLHTYYKWQTATQQKLIIYNVPKYQAIDLVNGSYYQFVGDSLLLKDAVLQNFHLKPARVALQLDNRLDSINTIFHQGLFYMFSGKRILLINKSISFEPGPQKINVDLIVISHNPRLYIPQLAKVFNCGQYIFDASNSLWKIAKWQKDCNMLHLQCYSIPERGAFFSDL